MYQMVHFVNSTRLKRASRPDVPQDDVDDLGPPRRQRPG
jgi:hypothetical protein